jgi:hypothetical protein
MITPAPISSTKVRQQAIEAAHFHVWQIGQRQPRQGDPLVMLKPGPLLELSATATTTRSNKRRGARHQVGVTVGDRIEGARINGQARIAQRFLFTNEKASFEGGSKMALA